MAINVTREKSSGGRRTLLSPYYVHKDDGAITYVDAEAAAQAAGITDWGVKPRDFTFRELSDNSYRFTHEYSLHAIRQHFAGAAEIETEIFETPRLFLPEPKSLIKNYEAIQESTSGSNSDLVRTYLDPAEREPVRVPLPARNATFHIDPPSVEKAASFYEALRACWGKLNSAAFQGHPAGTVMILTAGIVNDANEQPRVECGAAIGSPQDVSYTSASGTESMSGVKPFSWVGVRPDGESGGRVGPIGEVQVDGDAAALHEVRVFEEADYGALDIPEPA